MNKMIAAFALGMVACVAPTIPYIEEYRVGDLPKNWASHESSVKKVLTVYNPLDVPIDITVRCNGVFYDGHAKHTFSLAPKEESRAFVAVLASDSIDAVCEIL
jgi:hypothetical protein